MNSNNEKTLIPLPSKRVISSKTKIHYGKIINVLRSAVLDTKTYGHIVDASPNEMVEYLFNQRGRFRPSTFLMYRSALLWWISSLKVNEPVQRAWIKLHEPVPVDGYKDEKGREGATTLYSSKSSRKRTVSQKNIKRLLNELARRMEGSRTHVERRRASELRYWILAGLSTGLRPIEWGQAYWRNQSLGELNVMTAKRKEGFYSLPTIAHLADEEYMPTRIVRLNNDEDVFWVDMHMKAVHSYLSSNEGQTFTHYYNNNRLYLRSVCKKIFPNDSGITLYMLRGQFAANRKISGQPREELSEEMGCSPYYASAAYGKQIHGYKNLKGQYYAQADKEAQSDSENISLLQSQAQETNQVTTPVDKTPSLASPPSREDLPPSIPLAAKRQGQR